jgi:hypothetical protein
MKRRQPGSELGVRALATGGPLLAPESSSLQSREGQNDPAALANCAYKHRQHNSGVTDIVEIPDREHALTIDNGWRAVEDSALALVKRFV